MPNVTRSCSGSDDGGYIPGLIFDVTSNGDITLGNYGGGSATGLFRFTNITIPKAATITSAVLTITSANVDSTTTCNIVIYAVNQDNAAAFSSGADVDSRPYTSANAAWSNVGSFSTNVAAQSVDFASVVQEVINRAGWAIGNAINIVLFNNGSTAGARRRVYPSEAGFAPSISINYSVPTTAPPPRRRSTRFFRQMR